MARNKTVKFERMFEVDGELTEAAGEFDAKLTDMVDVRVGVGPLKRGDGFRPGTTVEGDGANVWTDSKGSVRECAVAEVSNYMFAVAAVQAFFVKGWKGLAATVVGLMVTAYLQMESEIEANRIRGGFIRNPSAGEKAAFERFGVKPVMRHGRCVGFAPIDPTEKRWELFAVRLERIGGSYRGALARDKDGNEMSPEAVVEALTTSLKASAKTAKARSVKAAATTKALGGSKPVHATMTQSKTVMAEIDGLLTELYGFDPKSNTANVDRANHIVAALRALKALRGEGEAEQTQLEVVNA